MRAARVAGPKNAVSFPRDPGPWGATVNPRELSACWSERVAGVVLPIDREIVGIEIVVGVDEIVGGVTRGCVGSTGTGCVYEEDTGPEPTLKSDGAGVGAGVGAVMVIVVVAEGVDVALLLLWSE